MATVELLLPPPQPYTKYGIWIEVSILLAEMRPLEGCGSYKEWIEVSILLTEVRPPQGLWIAQSMDGSIDTFD